MFGGQRILPRLATVFLDGNRRVSKLICSKMGLKSENDIQNIIQVAVANWLL